ncbi:CopD family protein [uncultured Tateyamaria sp.]|uniref:CopD family protein n=1 Tax=Tateyamaria sp. 1078 TaxID=3417464 RepID=UPI0026134B99|nr:CopD family protein [uncultured Tateyamaria sp.]
MLASLASADTVTWVSIIVKVIAYAGTLIAVGSVLVLVALREVDARGRTSLRRITVLAACVGAVFTVLRLPVRASFLMGGTWDGAMDPTILGMVAQSPLGPSAALRLVGLALILFVFWRARSGQVIAIVGAVLASASFALRGHALGEPQVILGALVTLHILCLAFWIGGLAPLAQAARSEPPIRAGALAHEFGGRALWSVGLLVLAGGITLALFGAASPAALSTPYGQMFAAKIALFVGVLSLAAINKLSLTPALLADMPQAGVRLRRSITLEAVLITAILCVTATLTTISSPK